MYLEQESVLHPYADLIVELAKQILGYNLKGGHPESKIFSETEEVSAIDMFITTFKAFLDKLESK